MKMFKNIPYIDTLNYLFWQYNLPRLDPNGGENITHKDTFEVATEAFLLAFLVIVRLSLATSLAQATYISDKVRWIATCWTVTGTVRDRGGRGEHRGADTQAMIPQIEAAIKSYPWVAHHLSCVTGAHQQYVSCAHCSLNAGAETGFTGERY